MTNQERYVYNRDNYEDGEIINWDDWAESMGIDAAEQDDKLEWNEYVRIRNSIKII